MWGTTTRVIQKPGVSPLPLTMYTKGPSAPPATPNKPVSAVCARRRARATRGARLSTMVRRLPRGRVLFHYLPSAASRKTSLLSYVQVITFCVPKTAINLQYGENYETLRHRNCRNSRVGTSVNWNGRHGCRSGTHRQQRSCRARRRLSQKLASWSVLPHGSEYWSCSLPLGESYRSRVRLQYRERWQPGLDNP